jgi:hypothetical protein
MVFGTAAGQQAAAREPAPHAHNPPANQTLVFGNSPVAPPPSQAHQTLVFGTSAGQQAAASEPAAPPPGPALNQTMVFGTAPVAPPQNPKATQVFGAPAVQPPAPAQRPAATTVMFGAGSLPPPPQPAANKAPNTTMMFGKPPEAVAPPPSKTMAFGTPVAAPKKPMPRVSAEEPEVEPEQRSESTVRVDLERMMREHEDEGGEEPVEHRHDRTQRFAMSDVEQKPEGGDAVQDRHNRTALFAMSTLQETTKPDALVPGKAAVIEATVETDPSLHGEPTMSALPEVTVGPDNSTLPHGFMRTGDTDPNAGDPPGVSTLLEPGADMKTTLRHEGPVVSTMPNLAPISPDATNAAHRSAPMQLDVGAVDLQGDLQGTSGTMPDAAPISADAQDPAVALAAQGRRRTIIAIVIVGLDRKSVV